MPNNINFKEFNPLEVPLEQSNLIEASAGTGKTYSIALLVLRTIIEKEIPLNKILIVTFTKAAVAELAMRIRLFLKTAHLIAKGQEQHDENIQHIVKSGLLKNHDKTCQLLEDALLLFDENAIYTIHGFCQHVLSHYPIETNFNQGTSVISNEADLWERCFNQVWRQRIAVLPKEFHKAVKIQRSDILEILNLVRNGASYHEDKHFDFVELDINHIRDQFQKAQVLEQNFNQELVDYFNLKFETILSRASTNKRALELFEQSNGNAEEFFKAILGKKSNKYCAVFEDDFKFYDTILEHKNAVDNFRNNIKRKIIAAVVHEVKANVEELLVEQNVVGYNGLITSVVNAIDQPESKLHYFLRQDYQAVFIDEFQDTDNEQYKIFHQLFHHHSLLFFIGDPKQSIYAFRGADLEIYFKARQDVDNVYTMNTNFRSTPSMITALNHFFKPTSDYDTFYMQSSEHELSYIPVASPNNSFDGCLLYNNEPLTVLNINAYKNQDEAYHTTLSLVSSLLYSGQYQLRTKHGDRSIEPSDIGILVEKNSTAITIKNLLSKNGIAATVTDESKVLQSQEAMWLLYFLEAVINPNISNINRALYQNWTSFNVEDILQLNQPIVIDKFESYQLLWQQQGLFSMTKKFLIDFHIQAYLQSVRSFDGERVLTNLNHITELLHSKQSKSKLDELQIIYWLTNAISGYNEEGDEYTLRMERDDESVRITTVHKSKGLEYNIVISPELNLASKLRYIDFVVLNNDQNRKVVKEKDLLTEDEKNDFLIYEQQENARKLYVALTRPVYAAFILYTTRSTTVFNTLVGQHNNQSLSYEIDIDYKFGDGEIYRPVQKLSESNHLLKLPAQINWQQPNWRALSYSGIALHPQQIPKDKRQDFQDHYDHFVFHDLAFGAQTGDLLHYIFERIHRAPLHRHQLVIQNAINIYAAGKNDLYHESLKTLVHHVLNAKIVIGNEEFFIKDIESKKTLPELSFDFPINGFNGKELYNINNEVVSIHLNNLGESLTNTEGLFNGIIDLFFEHQGKYYILDWKSNYLGYNIEDYSGNNLQQAMTDNNYHLQYLIYCVAIKKYLKSRSTQFSFQRDFGGVVYVFARGVRAQTTNGIFTYCPPEHLINQLESMLQ